MIDGFALFVHINLIGFLIELGLAKFRICAFMVIFTVNGWWNTFFTFKWSTLFQWVFSLWTIGGINTVKAILFCWINALFFRKLWYLSNNYFLAIFAWCSTWIFLYAINKFCQPAGIIKLIFFLHTRKLPIFLRLYGLTSVLSFRKTFRFWWSWFGIKMKPSFDLICEILFIFSNSLCILSSSLF